MAVTSADRQRKHRAFRKIESAILEYLALGGDPNYVLEDVKGTLKAAQSAFGYVRDADRGDALKRAA